MPLISTFAAGSSRGFGQSIASGGGAPAGRSFSISPSVSGKSTWNLDVDGPLDLSTAGTWTITPTSVFNMNIKTWGAGGSSSSLYSGGAGGSSVGVLATVASTSYIIRVGAVNGGGTVTGSAARGGGYSGVFITSETHGNARIIAGAGGGADFDDGGRGAAGGAGGGSSGQNGFGYTGVDTLGKGGTQSAGGAGGGGTYTGSPGSALTGGNGSATPGSGYAGGSGGSGYYGGGGGGMQSAWAGGGGGGGSGYIGGVTTATTYTGSGTTPGNSGDANRGTAGNVGVAGKVYLY